MTVPLQGINIAALNAVTDENTRIALQSLVDGISQAAIVTRSDLTTSQAIAEANAVAKARTYTDLIKTLTPGQINQAIDNLQSQIMESKLFKDLGLRVDMIDKPGGIFDRVGATELALIDETTQRMDGDTALSNSITAMGTRVGDAESAIKTEVEQRVNADNALQTTITTQYSAVNDSLALQQQAIVTNANGVGALSTSLTQLQASVDDLSSAISTEATARANADGDLYAQYTLRVDVGGRVSGFGLASDPNRSDFIIRADRFSVASPTTADGIPVKIPFIVTTSNDDSGNPPGVYMDMAMMKYAAITSAYISDAAVDTLKIAGNAVTLPVSAEYLYQTAHWWNQNGSYKEIASVSLGLPGNSGVLVFVSCVPGDDTGGNHTAYYYVTVESTYMGQTYLSSNYHSMPNNVGAMLNTWFLKWTTPNTGSANVTYTFRYWGTQVGDVEGFWFTNRRIMVMGSKR
jgi:hypothetical protein